MNPYFVLGVPVGADDAEIRRAYVEAVRDSPPDLAPERFQRISTAFEQIKNEASRHQYLLFDDTVPGDTPVGVFVRHVRFRPQPHPLPLLEMKELLRACSKT